MANEACGKCGNPKEMYYKLWCPRCDKPETDTVVTLNLLKALRYLELNGHPGIKDRIWKFMQDDIHNDSTITLPLIEKDDYDDYDDREEIEQIAADLTAVRQLANLGPDGDLMVEISW